MAVMDTRKWLKEYLRNKGSSRVNNLEHQRKCIIEKLVSYFPGSSSSAIHDHLLQHGLFLPNGQDEDIINSLNNDNPWKIAREELVRLAKEWGGPNIPVFIFPSDSNNRQLKRDFNGLSGVSHQDKVFLFVSGSTSQKELQAIITHEYNHVCRLYYLDKKEKDMELLDSIVLEGLAEMAVQERLGTDHLAKWTSIHPIDSALNYWRKWLKPNIKLSKADPRHNELLYGGGFVPKWLGYNAGYHLVSSFIKNKQMHIKETLHLPAEAIVEGSDFPV
ncbi:DUF2268 domain-containing protein [Virgibacillus sp. FSP13]